MNHLLVITSYPPQGQTHGAGTVGIASYAKNTIVALQRAMKRQEKECNITVLAEQLEQPSRYTEDGISVCRVWQRGSILAYWQLLRQIQTYPTAKTALVEFELSMFGGMLSLLLFPLFLLFLRLRGLRVFLVLHQVVDDINTMAGHIGIREKSVRTKVLNAAIALFYRLSLSQATRVIVFESYLKHNVSRFVSKERVEVIPHGVEPPPGAAPSREAARKQFGFKDNDCVLLYFGFIAWYKGADILVSMIGSEQLTMGDKTVKLLIAGGGNPNHDDKEHYQQYLRRINQLAQASDGRITITGFIQEKDIAACFTAADLVVLPYRTFMSSSGPLSLAFTYGRPVIVSEALQPYLQTDDFSQAMKESGVVEKDLFFSLQEPFALKKNATTLARLGNFSTRMRQKRAWDLIGERYANSLQETQ